MQILCVYIATRLVYTLLRFCTKLVHFLLKNRRSMYKYLQNFNFSVLLLHKQQNITRFVKRYINNFTRLLLLPHFFSSNFYFFFNVAHVHDFFPYLVVCRLFVIFFLFTQKLSCLNRTQNAWTCPGTKYFFFLWTTREWTNSNKFA